ncbi:MAG: DUF4249 domain-containing protein [Prevotella sp.]|nr:DUF4249 domain-containing protein [Prevotella sp.]
MHCALCIILSGCIEEYEADISSEDSDLLVVEGTICSEKWNKFILTRTEAIRSDEPLNSDMTYYSPRTVTGASVSVRGSDGTEYRAQVINGSYICWVDVLSPDVEYYLHIEADGEVYESAPQKPLRSEGIAEVSGVQNTPDSNIDVLVTPDVPFDPDKTNYYSWTYDETWEVHPDYTTNMYYDTVLKKGIFKMHQFPERGWKDGTSSIIMVGASSSYEGQHILQHKIYDVDRSDKRVYYKYSGLVHQRAISKAEYEYELARLQAGTEMGGLFTPLPSALPSNIHCLTSNKHVIGFVGCSLNTSDYRFFLDADDFSINYPHWVDTREWYEDPSDALCRRLLNEGLFLCVWKDERMSGGKFETAWTTEDHLDVRYQGAYIEKPVFWPEEDNDEE